jgi:hypothetical protein
VHDLRATLHASAAGCDVTMVPNRQESAKLLSAGRRFAIAMCLAILPQLLVISAYSQGLSPFVLLVLLWNVAPIATAAIFFVAGARFAAWGWLLATGLWGLWGVISVIASASSTASLAFMWTPVWSFTAVGPIGAGLAILHARTRG